MKQRSNEVKRILLRETLPVFPKTSQHRTHQIETICELVKFLRVQVSFVTAHLQPKLALLARTNGNLKKPLELNRRRPLRPPLYNVHGNGSCGSSYLSANFKLLMARKHSRGTRNVQS